MPRLSLFAVCLSATCLALRPAGSISAQAIAAAEAGGVTASATTNDTGPAGIIPYVKGYNLSLGTSSEHDSTNGWSSVLTPDLAFRFNRNFSADLSAPIYSYINVLVTGGTAAKPTQSYQTRNGIAGDTSLNGHYEAGFRLLDYNLTATLGLPSGSQTDGLGAGKVTYNFNNHLERSVSIFSPDIELGIGDNSSLVGSRIRKSYTTVGSLAYFQAGTSVDLPHQWGFNANAYEELPLASQIVYSTTGKGKKKKTTATNEGAAEDNGFQTSLDIPLQSHVTLSGFYNRSLRSHIDTAGFAFTFLLKAPPSEITR